MVGMLSLRLIRQSRSIAALVHATVDLANLLDPGSAFAMLQGENLLVWPVKVIGHIRYLLAESL
jgi:hypothetical protein